MFCSGGYPLEDLPAGGQEGLIALVRRGFGCIHFSHGWGSASRLRNEQIPPFLSCSRVSQRAGGACVSICCGRHVLISLALSSMSAVGPLGYLCFVAENCNSCFSLLVLRGPFLSTHPPHVCCLFLLLPVPQGMEPGLPWP
jgi:hypothetical protein